MQLTAELISQFQSIYKEDFGEEISVQEASRQGIQLIQLVQLIYQPMSKEEYIRVQEEISKIQERVNKRNKYGKVNILT